MINNKVDGMMYQDIFSLEANIIFEAPRDNFYTEHVNLTKIRTSTNLKAHELLEKYFHKWKDITKTRKNKINEFITTLKTHQKILLHCTAEHEQHKNLKALKPIKEFKNRYKVQHDIIEVQKEKIKEQNEIINELKLGIIREDLFKSMGSRKNVIREIFSNCSEKILCEAPLIKDVDERELMMISAQKAPKLVQKMQQRAIEREKYREVILERKRLKDEAQKKLLKELIEKKKYLEEEERKKNLEIINEQRKQELKLQKIRQQKKQWAEQKMSMAVNFHKKLLLGQCFRKLFNFYNRSRENNFLAESVFVHKEKLKIFKRWLGLVEDKYSVKYGMADAHYRYKTLKRSIVNWKEFRLECVRALQVAEDLYDFRLTSNIFIHWHRYVCKEIMIEHKKNRIAIQHNKRRILFQYFHQWICLPAVVKLEKSKETAKRKWREKVWEILPDFRPLEEL